MTNLLVQGQLQILQYGTGSYHTVLQVVHSESLQRCRAEVLLQLLTCRLLRKYPVIHRKRAVATIEKTHEELFLIPFEEHFLRLETAQQLLHIVAWTLTSHKLTRGDVEEGDANRVLSVRR